MMNAIMKFDPFKEMEVLQNRFAKLMGLPATRLENGEKEVMTLADWAPAVDIVEDEKEWMVKAELPEVKKEDVKVTVENGVLTITGERKMEKEERNKKYHRIERAYGNFMRTFTLPEMVDAAKVNAEFKDGLLKVHLAKTPKAAQKTIDIKAE